MKHSRNAKTEVAMRMLIEPSESDEAGNMGRNNADQTVSPMTPRIPPPEIESARRGMESCNIRRGEDYILAVKWALCKNPQ